MRTCLCSMIDNNFVPGFIGFIKSLLSNNPWFNLPIRLIDVGITNENKKKCLEYYSDIQFIKPDKTKYKNINFSATHPKLQNTYYKLEPFSWYRDWDRIVFIDLDTIVLTDIKKLFEIRAPFSACRAYNASTDMMRQDFNSGVWVVCKPVLNRNTFNNLVRMARPGFSMPDQKVFNKYFGGNFNKLPKEFNVEKRMWASKNHPYKWDGSDVKILHYVCDKPWQVEKPNDGKKYLALDRIWEMYYHMETETNKSENLSKIVKPKSGGITLIPRKISIRNAKNAKPGLQNLCKILQALTENRELTMVEIGSFAGDAAEIFAQFFNKVYCIDPWLSGYDSNDDASDPTKFNMKEVESQFDEIANTYNTIEKRKGKSLQRVKDFEDESLDFVYVDGLHTEQGVKQDIKAWLPKVKPNGFIGGHDYASKHHKQVKPTVDHLVGEPSYKFKDSSWLIAKEDIAGQLAD